MKRGMLCALLLFACGTPQGAPAGWTYTLTWTCRSPEGCEHTEELMRIDRMELVAASRDVYLTSTQDQALVVTGKQIFSDLLPPDCTWLYFVTLFGHELERSRLCFEPGGFTLELSIPNEEPTTFSMWRVTGRDLEVYYSDSD